MIEKQILAGIEAEMKTTPEPLKVLAIRYIVEQNYLKIFFNPRTLNHQKLDEAEGASVSWPNLVGEATIHSVDLKPGQECLIISGYTDSPLKVGDEIRITFPCYLRALHSAWSQSDWASSCLERLDQITRANQFDPGTVLNPDGFAKLRTQQKAAFQLAGWSTSFLWGPPGTGKTTVTGALIGQFLVQFPHSRILVISNTNHAVDQLLVMADKALEHMSQTQPEVQAIRPRCIRIGTHFNPVSYKGREHLICRGKWQGSPLPKFDNPFAQARLVALTTTRAIQSLNDLRQAGEFDWLVCDEAGQIGLSQAITLLPLAKKALFAGDPRQLGPIHKARNPEAEAWLGTSVFDRVHFDQPWICFLDEQSRMASPICTVVSQLFYENQLNLAADCEGSSTWHQGRQLDPALLFNRSVQQLPVTGSAVNSIRYGGYIRSESARVISQAVQDLKAAGLAEKHMVVVTPYRAQQKLIREYLRQKECQSVAVLTIHRAQGGEWHTVLFDPVDGKNSFFHGKSARRLVNVAMSRAKARFLITLSQTDCQNVILRELSVAIAEQEILAASRPADPAVAA